MSPQRSCSWAALNWGLVAVAKFDLVAWICGGMDFGQTNAASRVIYGLVGLAAVYGIASLLTARRRRHTAGDRGRFTHRPRAPARRLNEGNLER